MWLLLGICSSIYYLVGTSGGGRKNIEVHVLAILHVLLLFILLYTMLTVMNKHNMTCIRVLSKIYI